MTTPGICLVTAPASHTFSKRFIHSAAVSPRKRHRCSIQGDPSAGGWTGVGIAAVTKEIRFAASVSAPPAVAPLGCSFLSIPSEISRSVRADNFASPRRTMQPTRHSF